MNEFSRIDGVAHAVGVVQGRSDPGRNGSGRNGHAALEQMRDEVAEGLLYSHSRANANTNKTLEVASFSYALIELLAERGIITIEELDERKKIVGQRLVEKFVEKGMGVALTKDGGDKYAYQSETRIDCENRLQVCQAACCRLRFALSVQDVEEGIVKWDLGHPYMIRHTTGGYCHHLERGTCRCTIYGQRPVVCRSYDCRKDERIWLDFENKIINPELDSIFQPAAQAGSNGHAAGHQSEDG